MSPQPRPRERLRAFAHRVLSYSTGCDALWTAQRLWECWPPRKAPRPLLLLRLPDVTAEQWAGLRVKLEAARTELAAAGVPIWIEFEEAQATVGIELDGNRQLELGAAA